MTGQPPHQAANGSNGFTWHEAEDANARGIFTRFEVVIPSGATQVEQPGEVVDAAAVVADSDITIVVGDFDRRCARASSVLQNLDDPPCEGAGE